VQIHWENASVHGRIPKGGKESMKVHPFFACQKDQRIYIEVEALQDVPKVILQPVIQGRHSMFSQCVGCRYSDLKDVISREAKGCFPTIVKMGFCELRFEEVPNTEDGE
jgi:hypothetical protein